MKSYKEVTISPIKEEDVDLYIGLLTNLDYSGFEQDTDTLKAYINEENFDFVALDTLSKEFHFDFLTKEIAEQNWNAVWESNFVPVQVDDFVGIRAHFHPSFGDTVQYELTITPKMSFGTGHHATTYMMIQQIRQLNFSGKRILDFGTGTGVLAILAEKLGAKEVIAIDNDEWSIRNTQENIEANNVDHIRLYLASSVKTEIPYDIILANINRNIIVDNFEAIVKASKPNGIIVLSGLLAEDEPTILELATKYGLKHQNTLRRLQWISILLSK